MHFGPAAVVVVHRQNALLLPVVPGFAHVPFGDVEFLGEELVVDGHRRLGEALFEAVEVDLDVVPVGLGHVHIDKDIFHRRDAVIFVGLIEDKLRRMLIIHFR